MSRHTKRLLTSAVFVGVGLVLALTDLPLTVNFAPLWLVGYILVPIGVAGLLGVNIYWGGPLDKRLDAEDRVLSPEEQSEVAETVQRQGDQLRRFIAWVTWLPVLVVAVILVLIWLGVI